MNDMPTITDMLTVNTADIEEHQALEQRASALERERCAKIAEDAAAEAQKIGDNHPPCNSDIRDRLFARAREAAAIAVKIRSGK